MVISVSKWDVHPDKSQAYAAWVKTAVPKLLMVPGLSEFRAYRAVTGTTQVVTTYEFADLTAWAAWHTHAAVQQLIDERRCFTLNEVTELWGPSLLVSTLVRPANRWPVAAQSPQAARRAGHV